MSRLNIFVIGLVLAVAFDFVSASGHRYQYHIDIGEFNGTHLYMGSDANIENWDSPRDYEYIKDLQNEGTGSIITNVYMLIESTSSDRPEAKVVSGGVGQAHMRISIKVKNTTTFNYRADVYGLNF